MKSKHAMNYVQGQNLCQYQTNCNYNFYSKTNTKYKTWNIDTGLAN